MKSIRRNHSAEFKARVALEAIKGRKTTEQRTEVEKERLERKISQLVVSRKGDRHFSLLFPLLPI